MCKTQPPLAQQKMSTACPSGWSWDALARLVHPRKVEIIEAMLWIGRPVSAVELTRVFEGSASLGVVSHHLKSLARPGIVEPTGTRRAGGAVETFYQLVEVSHR